MHSWVPIWIQNTVYHNSAMSNCIAICKGAAPGVEQEDGFVFLKFPVNLLNSTIKMNNEDLMLRLDILQWLHGNNCASHPWPNVQVQIILLWRPYVKTLLSGED